MNGAILFVAVGALVILTAWVPLFIRRIPISLAILAVAAGLVLPLTGETVDPLRDHAAAVEHATEFALLVAVLGAGLKIDRPFTLRGWASTWRLLLVVMVLSIAAIAAAGHLLLGYSAGAALLVAAIIAPTDPVLAAHVQLGPPGVGEEGEAKFALTSEAGLNDGLALPFVLLGLAAVEGRLGSFDDLFDWIAINFAWDICAGIAVGVGLGWVLVGINRRLPEHLQLPSTNSGLVALGLAFLAYGLAVMLHGNGFVAVFCEAVAIRNLARSFDYSRHLNHVAAQFERVAMVIILALLGLSIAQGLLAPVGIPEIVFAVLVLLVVRPAATAIGFIGSHVSARTRIAIGYFGIRGIGSLYYVAFVAGESTTDLGRHLTAVVGLVVLFSVLLYGVTTDFAARRLLGKR